MLDLWNLTMDAPYPKDAPEPPADRPWRVTAYREVRARITRCFVVGDYKYYWQANAVSFIWHHFLGFGCNTWRRPD